MMKETKLRRTRGVVGCFVLFLGALITLGITMDCLGMGLLMFAEKHPNKPGKIMKRKVAEYIRPSLQREGLQINTESRSCNEHFNSTRNANMDVIRAYPRGNADDFIWKIRGNFTDPLHILPLPVFVTAVDADHYHEVKGLLKSIHKIIMNNSKYSKLKLILYDIGMKEEQLNTIMEHCKCEVRSWSPGRFPAHVQQLENRAYKPILIQKVLMEHGFVWWVDTSVRFHDEDINVAIQYAQDNSILFFTSSESRKQASITKHTHLKTFKFLQEDPCKFHPFSMTLTSNLLFHHDKVTQVLVEAWVSCALNVACIAPSGDVNKSVCGEGNHTINMCHQYDQSVFSILTRRIFHIHNLYPVDPKLRKLFDVQPGQIIPYF